MVDFSKRLSVSKKPKKTNPIDIYKELDRKSEAGPLRPTQEKVLEEWYNNRINQKDLIIKLHTGEGKTLIGLLILLSKLNSNEGPAIYVCPNKYLLQQVCLEAVKFGIPICTIDSNKEIPDEWYSGKRILIVYAHQMFNGKSKFGIGSRCEDIGCIILDDSHTCIDIIRDAFTVTIERENKDTPESANLYFKLLSLFEDDLRQQREGTFIDIKEGNNFENLIPVPYWAWNNKLSEVTRILQSFSINKFMLFTWPLIKDMLANCQAFVSTNQIEISPYTIPIHQFGSFHNAKNRILMSATTQDDSFFIKGLNFSPEAVKNPVINTTKLWSGEKMMLIPSLIDSAFDRKTIISDIMGNVSNAFGVVALIPGQYKATEYNNCGCIISTTNTIFSDIRSLKDKDFTKNYVFKNRYDGIDLPDESCRILVIDSLPYFDRVYDRYEEICRPNSDIINKKVAQKIEQGLGRSVRSVKDYSCILLIGSDLVKFIKSSKTRDYFSLQTQKQIDLGREIAEWAKEDFYEGCDKSKALRKLINQCLKRDEDWKNLYEETMDSIEAEDKISDMYDIFSEEKKADNFFYEGDVDNAIKTTQKIIDKYTTNNNFDKGWYLQTIARYKYSVNRAEADKLQKLAFQSNFELLKPQEAITYTKVSNINANRIKNICGWITNFKDYEDMLLDFNSILDNLSFGISAEKFENAMFQLGKLLGYYSERPDKMIRKGPDNLWYLGNNKYIIFECKSEVDTKRSTIHKYEVGQMNSHCGWFEHEYSDAPVIRVMIIPTKNVSSDADFTHDVKIMRSHSLTQLKQNVKCLFNELKTYDIHTLNNETLHNLLYQYKLNETDFMIYTEDPVKDTVK
ncbi:DEAD/DEAH box helicase [Anaerocolumna sp. AGMB13020]|uniref:DEAD/DEAH box helicase n=1 Tax=Anaerocolumna sp. AGMB13020 TaxID=3081750 RepID=UPI002953B243|nr:DEAD/DEAH box helicase [Anaerocolumna sp. AGMB13020]WOO35802.1 DEAD/DEAH box helicase [Anaerocolumna sp. AGMB13020]